MCFDPSDTSTQNAVEHKRRIVQLREKRVNENRRFLEKAAGQLREAHIEARDAEIALEEAQARVDAAHAALKIAVSYTANEFSATKDGYERLEGSRIELGEMIAEDEGLPVGQPTEGSEAFEAALVGAGVGGQDLVF